MMDELDDQKSARGLDEYWAMVVRRRWWILGPLFLGWLIVFASAWIIPPKYTSETVILVEPQKVPQQFVMPNVQVDLEERLQSITQQVLSRSRLLSIINNLHLYQGLFFSSPDDQIVQMRKDIKIDLVQTPPAPGKPAELTAFKVSYIADKPQIAQQVNTQLASFFIDENVRSQSGAVATNHELPRLAVDCRQRPTCSPGKTDSRVRGLPRWGSCRISCRAIFDPRGSPEHNCRQPSMPATGATTAGLPEIVRRTRIIDAMEGDRKALPR